MIITSWKVYSFPWDYVMVEMHLWKMFLTVSYTFKMETCHGWKVLAYIGEGLRTGKAT